MKPITATVGLTLSATLVLTAACSNSPKPTWPPLPSGTPAAGASGLKGNAPYYYGRPVACQMIGNTPIELHMWANENQVFGQLSLTGQLNQARTRLCKPATLTATWMQVETESGEPTELTPVGSQTFTFDGSWALRLRPPALDDCTKYTLVLRLGTRAMPELNVSPKAGYALAMAVLSKSPGTVVYTLFPRTPKTPENC